MAVAAGVGVLAAIAFAMPLGAQVVRDSAPAPRLEWRLDELVAHRAATQAGMGVMIPAGVYVRFGVVAAAGVVTGGAQPVGASARVDAVGRFLLDPLAEHAWGPYLAGGATYRADARDRGRAYLLAMVGVEGPRHGRIVPAIEAGIGGGVRVGVVLRRGQVTGWR